MADAPTFNLFSAATDVRSFAAGETIFKEGDPGDTLFAVQAGEVELVVRGDIVETVGVGGLFGEMALVAKEPRSATARAKTDCRIAVIDEKQFEFMTRNTPNFALNVLRLVVHRLRMMDQR